MNHYRISKIFILGAAIFMCSFGGITQADTSKHYRASSGDRILHGEPLDGVVRKAPWTFSLRLKGTHRCGGSFLSPKFSGDKVSGWSSLDADSIWGITAAHCVVDGSGSVMDASSLSICGGTLKISQNSAVCDGEEQAVKNIYIPTSSDLVGAYGPATLQNDIALIRLSAPTETMRQTRRSSVRPPSLRQAGWIYSPYTGLYTAGWGRTETGAASPDLLEVRVPLVDGRTCQQKYQVFGDTIHDGMVCAGYSSGEYDSCQGDSGGPLYYRPSAKLGRTSEPVLVGLVSWGRGCGNADLFGIYTSIKHFEDWIVSTIESES